jgi:hypothetical protein
MTYTTDMTFATKTEALAHLALFGFTAMPVRNRFVSHHVGDFGEKRVSFAHIETVGGYVNGSEIYAETSYIVHEVDQPL